MVKRTPKTPKENQISKLVEANVALASQVGDLEKALKESRERTAQANNNMLAMKEDRDESRKQFSDLKERLYNSEMEVSRLNGYVSRVREDDIVREELITTGDPDGEQRLVPKRKVEGPPMMLGYEPEVPYDSFGRAITRKPKHWVNY